VMKNRLTIRRESKGLDMLVQFLSQSRPEQRELTRKRRERNGELMKNALIPLLIIALRMPCAAQQPEKSFTGASRVFESRIIAGNRLEGPGSGSDGSQPLSSHAEAQAKLSHNAGNWAGSWSRTGSTLQDSSDVVISDVSSNSFFFELNAISGSHIEEFAGKASLTGNRASYTDEERNCTLKFFLEDRTLTLNVSDGCMLAVGCLIEGAYRTDTIRDLPTLKDLGVFETEIQEKAFMELIVMVNPESTIWAAVHDNDQVRYFTNDPASLRKLPRTIEQWRKDLPDSRIVYVSADADR
jgi:hypothetical protein